MTNKDWESIRYFTKDEKWGDPLKMNLHLLLMLDALRGHTGAPFIIHCGFESSGHAAESQHYLGRAVDFHATGISLADLFTYSMKFDFRGVGIYPGWNNPGLHLDVRRGGSYIPKVCWWRDEAGEYHYF